MGLELRTGTYGTYWGNTYDSSNALTTSQMEINAQYIWNALASQGWTLNAVCGMLGNMQSESSINPGRWQSDRVGGSAEGHGYGLVQWTPYTKYTNWVSGDPSTMDNNISRILYEVQNNLQWIATASYNYSFLDFTHSNDSPYNLAMAFLANYERPADPNQPSRGTQAQNWYNYLAQVPSGVYLARVLPFIRQIVTVTAPFGQYPSGGEHKGVDLSDGQNSPLYSIVNGTITDKGYQANGFGNYIVMKDSQTEQGFLYGHMRDASPLNVGDSVSIGTFVGIEGTTGNSTGIHLHVQSLDMTGLSNWVFGLPISGYLDPTIYMDFPNITDTRVYYNGTPRPEPIGRIKRKNFPWVLYANKLRNKRKI